MITLEACQVTQHCGSAIGGYSLFRWKNVTEVAGRKWLEEAEIMSKTKSETTLEKGDNLNFCFLANNFIVPTARRI